jgi:RNA polymerase sigma-70 factor (ECF subfamily)
MSEVAMLPEAYREVLMMYYYDDVTYQDVAVALGVSAATVNARLTKARAMLRERLSSMQR